jgi:hypothetical protein
MRCAIILAVIVVLSNGCKKSSSGSSGFTAPSGPPASTAVGTPAGAAATSTIGPGGGTVLSADGRVELKFPANALAADTDITIQPVANTAPGGKGLSYHLMPDGIKFKIPVSLIFHYTAADENGTLPYLFYIASQDSAGVWQADFKNRSVDTVAKTATLPISHFSVWDLGSSLSLFPSPPGVSAGGKSELFVIILSDEGDASPGAGGEFSLSPLPDATPVPNSNISNWAVNGKTGGDAQDGTVSGSETETYTAPATIDKQRTVQISGSMNFGIKGWNNGKQVLQTNKFILFTDILLQSHKLSFSVSVTFTWDKTSVLIDDVYTDAASFQVDIDGSTNTFSHFVNQAPTVKPSSGTYGLTQCDWVYDPIGLTNITGGLAIINPADNSLTLYISHTNTISPLWRYTDISDGFTYTIGGVPDIGYPSGLTFAAKDSAQNGVESNGFQVLTWSATPTQ